MPPGVDTQALSAKYRLSPEFQLVVASSWLAPEPFRAAQAERIASLCERKVSWRHVIELVDQHRVPTLVYTSLVRYAGELVPEDMLAALKKRSARSSTAALRYAAELLRVSNRFAAQGIDSISLKGIILSQRLYGNLATRHTRDLDILVKPEDLESADHLLVEEGYRRVFPASTMSYQRTRLVLALSHHYDYVHDKRGTTIELHWAIDDGAHNDFCKAVWRSSRPVSDPIGFECGVPGDDILPLLLASHGAKHRWSRLKWLSDLAMLFAEGQVNWSWDDLWRAAGPYDLRRSLLQSALLVNWLYQIPLDRPVQRAIQEDSKAVLLAGEAISAMLNSPGDESKTWSLFRYLYHLMPSAPSRVSLLKARCIYSGDVDAYSLPDRLWWLYYLLRMPSWIWRNHVRQH